MRVGGGPDVTSRPGGGGSSVSGKGDSQVHHALQAWTGICSALLLLLLIYSMKGRAVP